MTDDFAKRSVENPTMMSAKFFRTLFLPFAAVVIAAVCVWRIANPQPPNGFLDLPAQLRPAPVFQLHDTQSRIFRLNSYLNRHQIVLVFFDGDQGAENDAALQQLARFHETLKRESIIVAAISTALPQQNKSSANQLPFPILTDEVAAIENSVHQIWNRYIPAPTISQPGKTKPGVFLIDRKGEVAWKDGYPVPLTAEETERLIPILFSR